MHASLLPKLLEINAVKFGQFTLKSGQTSPIYIDLRLIVSYPSLLRAVAEAYWANIRSLNFDLLCGVPYTALPIATAISVAHDKPMVLRRKEAKEYGTKKIIEGAFQAGQRCLVIEDLITTGLSIFETIEPLEKEGLVVEDVAVLLDREQGGRKKLSDKGYRLHAVFTMTELLDHVFKAGLLDKTQIDNIRKVASNHA